MPCPYTTSIKILSHPTTKLLLFAAANVYGQRLLTTLISPPKSPKSLLKNKLLNHTSLNANEEIQLVTERSNELIINNSKSIVRADMRLGNLCHRSTYIFVIRPSDGKLFVQRRSLIKDYCPGYLECVAGGVVGKGESYKLNARRELEEELGISKAQLSRCFTFYYKDEEVNTWGEAYEVEWEGNPDSLVLQKSEVSEVLIPLS